MKSTKISTSKILGYTVSMKTYLALYLHFAYIILCFASACGTWYIHVHTKLAVDIMNIFAYRRNPVVSQL